jgi:hypothetical protein
VTTRHIARCTAVCEMLFWNSAIWKWITFQHCIMC